MMKLTQLSVLLIVIYLNNQKQRRVVLLVVTLFVPPTYILILMSIAIVRLFNFMPNNTKQMPRCVLPILGCLCRFKVVHCHSDI